MALRDRIRASRAFGVWRAVKAETQLARYRALLDECRVSATFTHDNLSSAVAGRASARRLLSDRPLITAFGANDWEASGLWQSFEAVGRLSLFDYTAHARARAGPRISEDGNRGRVPRACRRRRPQ
jgi:hypothetical protein